MLLSCELQLNHGTKSQFITSTSIPLIRISKGYKMAVPTCKNRLTGADVEESLCNAASRPESTVVQCNTHACPPK